MGNSGRPTIMFIIVLVVGFALYFIMTAVQSSLQPVIFDYMHWYNAIENDAVYRILWLIADSTEPFFHKTLFGGIFVAIGAFVAWVLDKRKSKYAGLPISYGTGLWPWIFLASWISLAISGILYGGLRFEGDAWIPTFVPYVSVAAAVIMLYGANFRNVLTGAILGATFTVPISMFIRQVICIPFGLPGVIASVTGMWVGGIIVFEVCKYLPWMEKVPYPQRDSDAITAPTPAMIDKKKNSFFVRRMLADYSEPMFTGNEIAGACLVIGSMLTWVLNPMQPYYGTGWFPALVLCQIITGAVAIYIYWPTFVEGEGGGTPTFIPVVSVAPAAILTYGPSMFIIVFSAVLGAIFAPPVAVMLHKRAPEHWAPLVANTFSMAFCSLMIGLLIQYLIMAFPALGAF